MRVRRHILLVGLWAAMSLMCCAACPLIEASENEPAVECVILMHGLGRTADSMEQMAMGLEAAGYATANLDYPSRDFPIEKLAMEVIPEGIRQCTELGAVRLHFVTHSMGGILLRYYLTRRFIKGLGRTVMLSPPNQGSEVVDNLKDNAFYQWFNGPSGQQLGTSDDSFVMGLGPVDFPVGVITGSVHAAFDSWFAGMIPGPDDGKVSVERAKVDGMADFLALPYAHPFIMEKTEVIEQTRYFLQNGKFLHRSSAGHQDLDDGNSVPADKSD